MGYIVLGCGAHRNVNWLFLARAGVRRSTRGFGMPLQVFREKLTLARARGIPLGSR